MKKSSNWGVALVRIVKKHRYILLASFIVLIGIFTLFATKAATNSVAIEAEAGTLSNSNLLASDSTASKSQAVKYKTQTTGRTPFVIMAAGDVAKSDTTRAKLTATLIKEIKPTYLLALGDLAYEDGSLSQFQTRYEPSWGQPEIIPVTKPTSGNHEYRTTGASGYFDYFASKGVPTGDRDKGYYAFTHDNWLFLMLNSECGEIAGGCSNSGAQVAFINNTLAQHPEKCVIASWHRPRATGGPSDGRPSSVHGDSTSVDPMWDKIVARKGIVLTGHNHFYTRMKPLNGDAALDPNGITSFVVGLGGASPYSIDFTDTREAAKSNVTGMLKMTLQGNKADFQYINANNKAVIDSGSITAGCAG